MGNTMQKQADLFDPDVNPFEDPAPPAEDDVQVAEAHEESAPRVEPLAAPCGFINCRNEPCRRLATQPVLLDGKPFVYRGVPMLHCDPACWRDVDPAQTADGVTAQDDADGDLPDRDDPGPEAPPDYDAWSGWERADDDGFGAGDERREEGEG
jgi:hypothetical protein